MGSDSVSQLQSEGFVVLDNVLSKAECKNLIDAIKVTESSIRKTQDKNATIYLDGDGPATICMPHLHDPKNFLPLLKLSPILELCREALQEPIMLLDCTAAYARNEKPRLHTDSRIPLPLPQFALQINCLIALNDFKESNGATRIVKGSHLFDTKPRPEQISDVQAETISVPQGSAICFYANTWHTAGTNVSGEERFSFGAFYGRWWLKPNYDFTKCGKEIFQMLDPELKELFGFNSIAPSSRKQRQYVRVPVENILNLSYEELMTPQSGEAF